MADEQSYQSFFQNDMMNCIGDGPMSFSDIDLRFDDDELFILESPTSPFVCEDNSDLATNHATTPHIKIQPPSRVGTMAIPDSNESFDNTVGERQPWHPLGVGVEGAQRDATLMEVKVSSSLASTLPSDATSVTTITDSGFASLDACETCGFVYKNNSNRRKHILTHIRPHKCQHPGCKKGTEGFATPNDLERHESCVHKKGLKKWWKCAFPNCQKTTKLHCFDRKDNFIAHIKRRHKEMTTNREIDDLVHRSQHEPTKEEIEEAIALKGTRPTASFPPQTNLARRSSRASARSHKVKSETASVRSGLAIPSKQQSLNIGNVSHSAPSTSFMPLSPCSPTNELAFIGGGADENAPQRYSMDGADIKRPIQGSQPLFANSFGSPRFGAYDSQSFDSFGSGSNFGHSSSWTSSLPAGVSQASFPQLAPEQIMQRRDFGSTLSNQMNCQTAYNSMAGIQSPTVKVEEPDGPYSFTSQYSQMSGTEFSGRGSAYSPRSSDISFSQSTQPRLLQSSPYPSLNTTFNQYQSPILSSPMLDASFQAMDIDYDPRSRPSQQGSGNYDLG